MKEIKIKKAGDIMVGSMRLDSETHKKILALTKKHNCSVQDIIKYIIHEEIDSYK